MLSHDKRVAEIIQRVNEKPELAALLEAIGHELRFEANASAVLSGDYGGDTGYGEKKAIFMAGRYFGYLEAKHGIGTHPTMDDIFNRLSIEDANDLLEFFMDAAAAGVISSIRQCGVCNEWMFAGRKDQNFCSPACRHKHYEQSPRAKQHRNAYMRWRHAMNDSRKWLDSGIPKRDRPTFEQWREHDEPTPREWQAILNAKKKGRK